MNKADLVDYYGSLSKAAKATGRTKGAASTWPDPPPFEIQCTFEVLTGGELKADRRNPRFRGNTIGIRKHFLRLKEIDAAEYERKAVDARMFKDALKTNY